MPHLPPAPTGHNIVTPICIAVLDHILEGYDPILRKFLVAGFRQGFRIGALGTIPVFDINTRNLQSAFKFPAVIDEKIAKELALGRICGPYNDVPMLPNYRISPLGVVPKKAPGEFRVIHHLSYPDGLSVNDAIPQEFSRVSYASIYDAIKFIKSSHDTVYMAKLDIESAFRILPVAPVDRPLLGFRWRGLFYMDAVLPMGCCSSCATFEAFSSALHWVAEHKLGVSGVVHFLDDFLFLANSENKCLNDVRAFISLCAEIGVPLAHSKTVLPTTELTFLGIILDSVLLEARLPLDKLEQGREMLQNFSLRAKVSLKELQSVIGVLNFACSVVVPGRAFLRRMIDLTVGITKPHHRIRLTQQAKADIAIWLEFFNSFNGRSFFLDELTVSSDSLRLFTDSAGSIGYGAVCGNSWFYGTWPDVWLQYNITTLELYPIVAAIVTWGAAWKNRSVCFYTDNEAVVAIINKQTSRDAAVMTLLRKLVLCCMQFNILFTAKHVAGRDNILADRLSRLQVAQFRKLAPWAADRPTMVPRQISPAGLGAL